MDEACLQQGSSGRRLEILLRVWCAHRITKINPEISNRSPARQKHDNLQSLWDFFVPKNSSSLFKSKSRCCTWEKPPTVLVCQGAYKKTAPGVRPGLPKSAEAISQHAVDHRSSHVWCHGVKPFVEGPVVHFQGEVLVRES